MATFTSLHGSPRPAWLDRHREEILEPLLPIVDPHHHLWTTPYPYLLPDLLQDLTSGHNVQATVFVECGAMYRASGPERMRVVGETEYVAGIAGKAADLGDLRIAAGIVGRADLTMDDVETVLEAHIAVGRGRFRGIRQTLAYHPDPAARGTTANPRPDLMRDPAFRQGIALLGKCSLSFDAFLYHTQLPDLLSLARACPDTTIVIDHAGSPLGIGPFAGKRQEVYADWGRSIRELALVPNIFMKLGGLGMRLTGIDMHLREKPPSSEELAQLWAPYVHTCVEAFGARRCMFESNFPVDKATVSYSVLWNAYKRLAASYSADEKEWLFNRTASSTYRLSGEGSAIS